MQKSDNSRNLLKIHVVFNSQEDQRIIYPIITQIPHKLYYFTAFIKSTGQHDEHMDFFDKNSTYLKKNIPSLEIIQKEVDYTNYIEVIQELSKIIRDERNNHPNCENRINIGTGSNITSLASTEAARLWNCQVFYVYATEYGPSMEGARHKGDMIIAEPTIFPIYKPKTIFIEILKIIENEIKKKYADKESESVQRFIYKKHLIEILKDRDILKLHSYHTNTRKLQSSYYLKINKLYL